jgi:hypothetical protein
MGDFLCELLRYFGLYYVGLRGNREAYGEQGVESDVPAFVWPGLRSKRWP